LIQYKEAQSILEALQLKLNGEIEIDTVLLGLSGPLTQSAKLIKQKQRRQKEKLAKPAKQASSKDQKVKPKGSNSKASEPLNHRSSSTYTALPNGRTASKLSTKKNKTRRYIHPDARLQGEINNAQSLAEYALERFNL